MSLDSFECKLTNKAGVPVSASGGSSVRSGSGLFTLRLSLIYAYNNALQNVLNELLSNMNSMCSSGEATRARYK